MVITYLYRRFPLDDRGTMESQLHKTTLLALYQLSLVLGIVLFPIAIITQRLGVRLPVERLVTGLNEAYEQASA